MPLVTVAQMLKDAEAGGYAVGAFNINNLEFVQGVVEAAEEERAPVILQASEGAIKYVGIDYAVAIARIAAEMVSVPVAIHLDHGHSFEQAMQCIRAGFSSVMVDGSKYPLDENIELTRRVVEAGHAVGVSVEGELGKITGTEDNVFVSERESLFTDPAEAERFVRETGVDSIAVAVGSAHGHYKLEPKLDFDRLTEIRRRVNIPIVLHGGSGIPDESVRRAIGLGVRKVNVNTDNMQAFTDKMREILAADPGIFDPRKVLGPAKEAMKVVIRQKIGVFGCNGKA
ncbi:MAG: class II fructose-1,6-bisphosphate aldolase [bacterium]|jgi:fructose-bisphosphate aldolase class II